MSFVAGVGVSNLDMIYTGIGRLPDCLLYTSTELSSGIILYNYRTTTLTIQIYTYVSRGSYGIAAAMATILSLMTSISLIGLMLYSKNKNVMF